MKKYLVIKHYKALSSVVETSFDVKEDAFQYARLCEVRDDNKYEYIVAEVLQCKREMSTRQVFSPLLTYHYCLTTNKHMLLTNDNQY